MPLAHLIAEAKKNTPILRERTVSKAEVASIQRTDLRREMAEISEAEKAIAVREKIVPGWAQCQYLKSVGERQMCTQYMVLCAKESCQKKFMEADFFDFKKYLKQGKSIK